MLPFLTLMELLRLYSFVGYKQLVHHKCDRILRSSVVKIKCIQEIKPIQIVLQILCCNTFESHYLIVSSVGDNYLRYGYGKSLLRSF